MRLVSKSLLRSLLRYREVFNNFEINAEKNKEIVLKAGLDDRQTDRTFINDRKDFRGNFLKRIENRENIQYFR